VAFERFFKNHILTRMLRNSPRLVQTLKNSPRLVHFLVAEKKIRTIGTKDWKLAKNKTYCYK